MRRKTKLNADAANRTLTALPGLRAGSFLLVLSGLIWLPQAGFLAYSVQRLSNNGQFTDIILPAFAVLALGIMRAFIEMAGNRIVFRTARKAVTSLRETACNALAKRSPLDIQKPSSGMAASLIAEQSEAVLPYLQRFQPVQYKLSFIPVVIIVCIGWYSWLAALILMVVAPLIPFFMALIGSRAKKASEARMVEVGSMNAFLLDRLRGLSSIRSLDAVDATALRFRASAQNLKKRTMAVLRIAFLSSTVLELFSALGVAMVAVYVGFHFLGQLSFGTWGEKLTLGQGLFILLLAPAFFEPLQELSAAWHDRANGRAAIAALDQLCEGELFLVGREAEAEPCVIAKTTSPPQIQFSQILFQHRGASLPLFKDFSISVHAGEKLALLGPSGSGKSTLLAILSGLVPLSSGLVLIDETRLSPETATRLRKRMIWIGQKPHIFSGTLRSNILMGREGILQTEINDALQKAALDTVFQSHKGAIGEGGIGLSGGETLRLALARAMLALDGDIVLADEPTAHLDLVTATDVTEGILALAKGKTLIVATHDEALAARMDRIIRLGDAL